jgi:predicted DNA-binding transcriptional regulator AlpA
MKHSATANSTNNNQYYDQLPDDALIRSKQLVNCGLIPFSLPTLWRKTKAGSFPTAVHVSTGITAWRLGDIRVWLKDPEGYSVIAAYKRSDSLSGQAKQKVTEGL